MALCSYFIVLVLHLVHIKRTLLVAVEEMLHFERKMFHYHIQLCAFSRNHFGLNCFLEINYLLYTMHFSEEDHLFSNDVIHQLCLSKELSKIRFFSSDDFSLSFH